MYIFCQGDLLQGRTREPSFVSDLGALLCYVLFCSVCRPSIVPSSIVPSFDSCGAPQPNAIARIVSLDSTKKIIIVAKRHIKPGEEVGGTNQRQPINAVRFSVDARRG